MVVLVCSWTKSETRAMSLFCCGLLRAVLDSLCSTDGSETQFGDNGAAEMTFGRCGQIPIYVRLQTAFLVATTRSCLQASSFQALVHDSWLQTLLLCIFCV